MSLDAQAQARKDRLAHLRQLKRKREGSDDGDAAARREDDSEIVLSRRNYDPDSRAPIQGYLEPPSALGGEETLEAAAEKIAKDVLTDDPAVKTEEGEPEVADDEELDITTLQPRRANWDLKRDLQDKLDVLERRTDVAINKLVKERLGPRAADAVMDLNREVDATESREYGEAEAETDALTAARENAEKEDDAALGVATAVEDEEPVEAAPITPSNLMLYHLYRKAEFHRQRY
ncbi:cwf18 pre-mRNA splicing factor-domain-containing protein [Dipodascopsis tothii]|uniref:cwf18 pre-mRNA splicing factor-domain-containing protein n=1 Tax=Dipodascopsis tothii TaxID=44089 RepID=UPI0034CEF2B8